MTTKNNAAKVAPRMLASLLSAAIVGITCEAHRAREGVLRNGGMNDADLPSSLFEFFQAALDKKGVAEHTVEARRIAEAVRLQDGGWPSVIGRVLDWLTADRSLWIRAVQVALTNFDPPNDDVPDSVSLSSLLLSELFHANKVDAMAFIASLSEQDLHALQRVVPDLALVQDVALALFGRCSSVRGDGQSPALADKMTSWAARNRAQARLLVDSRVAELDRDNPIPVWSVEPLVEGIMRIEGSEVETLLAWRGVVLKLLLESANPRRHGLAAYLACAAWPPNHCAINERHAALLVVVRRSPGELIPAALDAVTRDVWENQDTVFDTLVAIAGMVADGVLHEKHTQQLLRGIASVAARGVATLKDRPLPAATKPLVAFLLAIPPSPRDHALDHLLSDMWKRDRQMVETFLADYVRIHAIEFIRTSSTFDSVFASLAQAAGAEIVGGWLVQWIIDNDRAVRQCAASWVAGDMEIGLSPTALVALPVEHAKALVHVLLATDLPGESLFATLTTVAEARDDLFELVKATFIEELSTDYPVLTRRWVEQIEQKGASAKASLLELAVELRAKLRVRDGVSEIRRQTPELFASSPCLGIWMELHDDAQAVMQHEAMKRSFFSQLMSTVHIARGEATTHSLTATPTPFLHQEFSYEQSVRSVLDPVGRRMVRSEHLGIVQALLVLAESK
jgi:hypothetical protein